MVITINRCSHEQSIPAIPNIIIKLLIYIYYHFMII